MKDIIKFDNWMKSIKNIYYFNNERMAAAYEIIKENEKVQHSKLRLIQK